MDWGGWQAAVHGVRVRHDWVTNIHRPCSLNKALSPPEQVFRASPAPQGCSPRLWRSWTTSRFSVCFMPSFPPWPRYQLNFVQDPTQQSHGSWASPDGAGAGVWLNPLEGRTPRECCQKLQSTVLSGAHGSARNPTCQGKSSFPFTSPHAGPKETDKGMRPAWSQDKEAQPRRLPWPRLNPRLPRWQRPLDGGARRGLW